MSSKVAEAEDKDQAGFEPGVSENIEKVDKRQLLAVMMSVLLGLLLAALDQTIVGPAMPRVIGDLNGFESYSWVFTIYLLTSTVTVPIAGKLSDMYGRKWLYVVGIVIFLIGSALSGFSGDILQLIAFRGIQGLGAGILMACAFAIIADLIPPADRGKWQGAFGGVWGFASVVGPTVGGFLTDQLNWRWVFFVNIPIGLIALAVLIVTFPHTKREVHKHTIDWLGAATLTAGVTPLLIALSLGGQPGWDWGSAPMLALFGAAALFLVAFVIVELKAKEAIIPLNLFKNGIFTTSMITVLVSGVGMFGAIIYIPLFIQAVQGDSATSSGNAVTPMTLAVVVASIISGQVISRTGKYRTMGIVGMALVTLGSFLLYTMNMNTDRLTAIFYMVVTGLGMGITFPLYTLVVQNAFPVSQVGVVTAAVQFFRSIGGTLGVAILGTVVNNQFKDRLGPELTARVNQLPPEVASRVPVDMLVAGLASGNPQALVSNESVQRLHDQFVQLGVPANFADALVTLVLDAMKPALYSGIQEAFLIGAIMVAVGLVTTIFLKEIPLRRSNKAGVKQQDTAEQAEKAGKEMAGGGMPGGSVIPAEDQPRLLTH